MDPLAKKPALATTAASLDTCGRTVGPLEEEQQTKDRSPKGPPKRNAKGGKGVSSLEENKPEAETAETDYLSIAGLEEWSEDEVKVEDTTQRINKFYQNTVPVKRKSLHREESLYSPRKEEKSPVPVKRKSLHREESP